MEGRKFDNEDEPQIHAENDPKTEQALQPPALDAEFRPAEDKQKQGVDESRRIA